MADLITAECDPLHLNKDYLYELLGCDELSTEEQIAAEYKIKAKRLHPDKNSGNDESHETTEEFIRLTKAKNILCDNDQRKKYDFWRRSGLAIPFEVWLKTDKANHMSVHWAPKPKKEKMLQSCHHEPGEILQVAETGTAGRLKGCNTVPQTDKTFQTQFWERKSSWGDSRLNKFRSYRI